MIREKWIIGVRNKIASLRMECDSLAAIEYSQLTPKEREDLQAYMKKIVDYIDKKLKKSEPKKNNKKK